MGAGHLHPALAPLTWLGLALFAYTLYGLRSRLTRVLAVPVAMWASIFLSQIWLARTFSHFMGPLVHMDPVPLWVSLPTWLIAAAIPATHASIPIALGLLCLSRLPLRVWLPAALLLGEALKGAMGFTLGDLMHGQWAIEAVLRSVALVGLPVTAALGCYVAVSAGEALASRQRRDLIGAIPALLWFVLLPPIPPADDALLAVAATHLADFERRPAPDELAKSVELVLWPEAAFRGAFTHWEGPQEPPWRLDALDGWEGLQHVVNLRLKRPGQTLNAIGLTDAVGRILTLRGKRSLVPWGERPYGGIDPLFSIDARGETPPLIRSSAGAFVPTICYEVFERSLFIEGVALGADLLVNIGNDRATGPTDLGVRQATGVLALRAAETHRPAARASLHGRASLISSTGAILALSAPGTSGALTWPVPKEAPTQPAKATPQIAILSDGAMPDPFPCAAPSCIALNVESFSCAPGMEDVDAVVVSGHSLPPRYLGMTPETLAEEIACMTPQLLVLDTCYGFSAPLLAALAAAGVDALAIGPEEQVAQVGLRYGDEFFSGGSPTRRAASITASTGNPLQVWAIDGPSLTQAHDEIRAMTPTELTARLKRVHPNLVHAPLEAGVSALFLVPPERFKGALPSSLPPGGGPVWQLKPQL